MVRDDSLCCTWVAACDYVDKRIFEVRFSSGCLGVPGFHHPWLWNGNGTGIMAPRLWDHLGMCGYGSMSLSWNSVTCTKASSIAWAGASFVLGG